VLSAGDVSYWSEADVTLTPKDANLSASILEIRVPSTLRAWQGPAFAGAAQFRQ